MRRFLIILFSFFLSTIAATFLLFSVKHGQASINPPPFSNGVDQQIVSKLHPALIRLLRDNRPGETLPIIVEWKRSDKIYQQPIQLLKSSQLNQRRAFVSALQTDTEIQTTDLMRILDQSQRKGQVKDIQRFWISPIISLKANPQIIHELALRDDVAFIRPDEKIVLQEDFSSVIPTSITSVDEWLSNLDMIDVDQVQELFGFNGNGVVVANIDTGVDYYHPALMKKYRGYNPNGIPNHEGNWYVVTGEPYIYPGDGYGHGTHTMGIILGDDGTGQRSGVAPGAKWIAVKAFTNQGYTHESWLHAAFQWVLAPTGDPTLAPDIVNNSWGSENGSDERFRNDVKALRAAGIFTVFSAGNNGPTQGTIGSPASYPEAFSVGAVDSVKLPASFSSRGPSPWNEIKPEISAPGVNIFSSFPGGGYIKMSGTSMATPHVAGVAALLLQANPNLSLDQLEQTLIGSAEPLGNRIPNNDTGYGLVNALSAVMQVTQNGILNGYVVSDESNQGIPYPNITLTNRDPVDPTQIVISGNQNGFYQVALLPGVYDITFSAFGYEPKTIYGQTIILNQEATVNVNLTPVQSAILTGKVLDAANSTPLSATIHVDDTPVQVQTDPISGVYQLSLPTGMYTLTVRSDAHRILHSTQMVQSGQTYNRDFSLDPALNILLVDSGAWYYGSEIDYYEKVLQQLDYPYHKWTIHSPFGSAGIPDDRPTTSTLNAYNLVIWSAPLDSPGLLNLGTVISSYLSSGGNLLLSGEDIAYFDGAGPNYNPQQPYFEKLFGLRFYNEGNVEPLYGVPKTAFASNYLELNTTDSAQNQYTPDAVEILNDALAQPILRWLDQEIGGTVAQACVPYKALWLGFGLEGSGPGANRIDFFDKVLTWFSSPKPSLSFITKTKRYETISTPGTMITATFNIINNGTQGDTYDLNMSGHSWSSSILLPDGTSFSDHTDLAIPACQSQTLTATIQIPPDALRDESSPLLLSIISQNNPALTATLTASAKTPAPILIVDDQLFYNHLSEYTSTLEPLKNRYDIYQTNGFYSPPTDTLNRYPMIVWITGYDWYSTLSLDDEKRLSLFLDQGNGFLLSSQDVLDIRGIDDFFRTKMGIAGVTLSVTPTQAIFTPNNSLNLPPKSTPLTFPFTNWGDAIKPTENTEAVFYDENLNTIGVLHPNENARSAFFTFPLETLPDTPRKELLNRALFWLSPFGNTKFILPGAVAKGAEFPIEIRLQRRTPTQGINQMVFPLPDELTLKPNSIEGDWSYDATKNALIWQGGLQANQLIALRAVLLIPPNISTDPPFLLTFQFYDEKGFLINYQQAIPINQSTIMFNQEWSPHQAKAGDIIAFTLTLTNSGSIADSINLTETLKDGLQLILESLHYQNGTIEVHPQGFNWQSMLSPGEVETYNYTTRVTQIKPGGFLFVQSDWRTSFDEGIAYARIDLPWIYYFPFVGSP